MMSFGAEAIAIILFATAITVYKYAEGFLIGVNIMLSTFVISFFFMIAEKLTFYFWKFCTEYPEMKIKLIKNKAHRERM